MKIALNLGVKGKYILVPIAASVMLIAIGIILGDISVLGNLIFIAFFIALAPYFLYKYSRFLWVKSIENQFPNFIRDMADAIRSGMSFPEAIRITTKSNYGKLTPEVIRMNNRLSWGTPLLRVIEIFGNSVKDSKIIREALNIIRQSFETGGDSASTMDSIATNTILIKEAEKERASVIRQQVMIMYGIFYMFLAIAIVIILVMVPMVQNQSLPSSEISGLSSLQFTNPCQDVFFFPCDYFNGVASIFNAGKGIGGYYLAMFFTVVLIQGIFSGLIAGQLEQNSIVAGVKHALIIVFSSIGIFIFLSKAGLLPV